MPREILPCDGCPQDVKCMLADECAGKGTGMIEKDEIDFSQLEKALDKTKKPGKPNDS